MNKRIKKLLSLMVVLVTTTAFAACSSDDEDSGNSHNISFKVVPETLAFTNAGGTEKVNVQSIAVPTVTSSASDWLSVSVGQQSANLKVTPITVTAAANTGTDDRTATITISAGSETKTVNVTQLASDGLLLSQTAYEIGAEGGTVSITLSTNGTVTQSISAGWVSENTSRSSMQSQTRTYSVAANLGPARSATVTFTLGNLKAEATINQAAGKSGDITATAKDIVKQMYPAWNLGNTMEGGNQANNWTNNGGVAAETSWQSTKTTQAIIDFVKSQGFKSVRIPTAWVMGHITDKDNVTIDAAWMSRVQEIVDYCISDGLYVFLNDHWDGGWLENSFGDISESTVTSNSEKLSKLWTQIAAHFKDYDEHLIFGGLNEPGMNGDSFDASTTSALLRYEQAFIDAVRATGGNNDKRTLVVQGPQTDIEQTCDAANNFNPARLTDPAGTGYLMVEVHCYTPWVFCGLESDETWGRMRYYWGDGNGSGDRYYSNGESELKTQFKKMYDTFVSKGWPVLIGECGANQRFAIGSDADHDASIKAWYKTITTEAVNNGCVPFYWDTNYTGYPNMTIINRNTQKVNNQMMLDGINEGLAAAQWPN